MEIQVADLNDLCNAKTQRVEALKKQGIQSEKNRVEVLKAAKQSIRAAALKFQSQAVLAEQAIADNQLLKEELLSAHRVMEGFKEKAQKLTHMRRELADLRAELGVMAKTQMEIEERAALEVAKCRQESLLLQAELEQNHTRITASSSPGAVVETAKSPSSSPSPKLRRDSKKMERMSTPHGQSIMIKPEITDSQSGDLFPAVRGASLLLKN